MITTCLLLIRSEYIGQNGCELFLVMYLLFHFNTNFGDISKLWVKFAWQLDEYVAASLSLTPQVGICCGFFVHLSPLRRSPSQSLHWQKGLQIHPSVGLRLSRALTVKSRWREERGRQQRPEGWGEGWRRRRRRWGSSPLFFFLPEQWKCWWVTPNTNIHTHSNGCFMSTM